MGRHVMSITYKPKIDAVFDGRCRQTIRLGRRYTVGDEVLIYEWTGRPRRSKWGRRMRVTLTDAFNITLAGGGIGLEAFPDEGEYSWRSRLADAYAAQDFIDPPTGEELKRVLEAFHGPLTGQPAQILRW